MSLSPAGLHDSSYCTWTDAEAIARPLANAMLAAKGPEGEIIAALDEALFGGDDD